jgi:hypothetical protein
MAVFSVTSEKYLATLFSIDILFSIPVQGFSNNIKYRHTDSLVSQSRLFEKSVLLKARHEYQIDAETRTFFV